MRSFTLLMVSMFSAAVLACSSDGEEAPPPGADGAAGSGGTGGGAGAAGADAAAGAAGEEGGIVEDAGDVSAPEDVVSDAPVCALEDGAGACDVCESASCCVEKTACYANAACLAADESLDTCVDVADGGATGVAACYTTFGATGTEAQTLLNCLRTSCMAQCGIPAATD